MLRYSLNRSKRQNKKIETHSKVVGKYDGWIAQYNIEYSDEYDNHESGLKKDDFIVNDKKDDFEEIPSESGDDYSETEESEYNPSDSEDDYSEHNQLETESVVSTDSVEEDYEDLSEEYLSDGDSDYDPETDSYEYSDSIESELESVDDLENIEDEYEKTFTNLEMNAIIEKLELNRRKDIVDLMFLGNILLLITTCMFTFILLFKTH